MRSFLALCVLSVLLCVSAYAQVGHCDCVCKQGTQRCVPSLPHMCDNACSMSACGSSQQVDHLKTRWSNGACQAIIVEGNYDTLVAHVQWSIGHQGARVWTGQDGNLLRTGEDLRAALIPPATNSDVQHYKDVAQAVHELREAKPETLERAATEAINRCVAAFPDNVAFTHFEWVGNHENRKWDLAGCQRAKNYDCVRGIFSDAQKDHDEFRNNLYCYSGQKIDALMSRLGPIPPPPPPVQRPTRDVTAHPDK